MTGLPEQNPHSEMDRLDKAAGQTIAAYGITPYGSENRDGEKNVRLIFERGMFRCSAPNIRNFAFVRFFSGDARAALLPPEFLDTVVALGDNHPVQETGQPPRTRWVTEGTGFLYGYLVKDDPDSQKKRYVVFLVTAGHVIRSKIDASKTSIRVRLDKTGTSAQDLEIPITQWFFHPDPQIDLAAVATHITYLKANGFQSNFFNSDDHALTKSQLKENGASVGDGVFILGFPMSLTGEQRNYTILRQGAIARMSEFLDGASKDFLVDAFVFPGNSGGPVILKPEIAAIQGTKSNHKASLIGIVKSYQPYTDIAISQQTNAHE